VLPKIKELTPSAKTADSVNTALTASTDTATGNQATQADPVSGDQATQADSASGNQATPPDSASETPTKAERNTLFGIPLDSYNIITGKVKRNQFISSILAAHGVAWNDIEKLPQ